MISTILIKVSFGTVGLLNNLLMISAVLFGVCILAIQKRYDRLEQSSWRPDRSRAVLQITSGAKPVFLHRVGIALFELEQAAAMSRFRQHQPFDLVDDNSNTHKIFKAEFRTR